VTDRVLVTRDGAVVTVTLNRPEKLNALDGEMVSGLLDALAGLATDEGVRVVVLTGAGRGFCAGGDVESLADRGGRPDSSGPRDLRSLMRIGELLHGMPKATIARVNGPCAGAGLSFACACDLRYAARSSVFTTAFLKVGASGDHGSAWFLTRAVGSARARELLLLSDRLDAGESARIGLVHEVVDDDELAARVDEVAATLAGAPATALANMKHNLADAVTLPLAEYLDRETERFAATTESGDTRAAARSFLDRR
jgi:2-(1,2-epoxy-1,2-dihydrophenyl)acetyl-CoA isomerase